jgi:hypothetical protein
MCLGQSSNRLNHTLRNIYATPFALLRKRGCVFTRNYFTKKTQVDLSNAILWIPDSKTENGISEIPLTSLAVEAFRNQIGISGDGEFLFPSDETPTKHLKSVKTAWRNTLRRAGI